MSDEPALFEVDETMTVAQVNRKLTEAIRRTLPRDIWVRGQIRNLSRSAAGHVYFDLIDPVEAGRQPRAAIAVTLFDSNKQIVNRVIKRSGNHMRMADGVEVRIRAAVELYSPRGQLQLNMSSIDPEFTLGRLGADREQLLEMLRVEGLLDANSEVPMPVVPLRVGLITSVNSAAWADFTEQLTASPYAFAIREFDVRVQGEFAADDMATVLAQAATTDLDVIAIVRGGGAKTDLAAFDAESIARAIASSALPVVTGIGHETDDAVADRVAHRSFKTPTAVAQHLIDTVALFDSGLVGRSALLHDRATSALRSAHILVDDAARLTIDRGTGATAQARTRNAETTFQLDRDVRRLLTTSINRLDIYETSLTRVSSVAPAIATQALDRRVERLTATSRRLLGTESHHLDLQRALLQAHDPQNALRRGWTITLRSDGSLLRSIDQATTGDVLRTRVLDGEVRSVIAPEETDT